MSDIQHCAFCGAVIPPRVMAHRRDAKHHFCNREHAIAWQRQTGHYKAMSDAGREARGAAVTTSNAQHPRKPRTLVHCALCDKVIPPAVLKRRGGRPAQRHFCDKECRKAWEKRRGYYSKISAKGKAARNVAVAESNKEKPRRKKIVVQVPQGQGSEISQRHL
jgi:hypothetical protein